MTSPPNPPHTHDPAHLIQQLRDRWLARFFALILAGLVPLLGYAWLGLKPQLEASITEQTTQRLNALETRTGEQLAELTAALDRLQAKIDLEPELRSLIGLRCMGTRNVNVTIDRLKRDYRRRTGEDYIEPDCARLVPPI